MSFLARIVRGGGGGISSPNSSSPPHSNASLSTTSEHRQTIEKLCNRLVGASLLEDRRSSAQTLKSLAKQCHHELGMRGLESIKTALQKDSDDEELVKFLLETLITILTVSQAESLETREFALSVAEILLKDDTLLEVTLRHLATSELRALRFAILQFLTIVNEILPPGRLASTIVKSPRGDGIAQLVAVLGPRISKDNSKSYNFGTDDGEEIIRQEARLLLRELACTSSEVQRMAAFDGAFEKLFATAEQEGGLFQPATLNSASIVADSLKTVLVLLKSNAPNQNYFRESPCLRQLCALLIPPPSTPNFWNDTEADKHIVDNDKTLLEDIQDEAYLIACEIIQVLLKVSTPSTLQIQNQLFKMGILPSLLQISLARSLYANIAWQIAALQTLALLLEKNSVIQREFNIITVPGQPVPAILSTIQLVLQSSQNWRLRRSAVDLIGAFLSDNEDGQLAIAGTFYSPVLSARPSEGFARANGNNLISPLLEGSAGSIILASLQDTSSLRKGKRGDPWRINLATLLLAHILRDNPQCKALALAYKPINEDYDEEGDKDDRSETGQVSGRSSQAETRSYLLSQIINLLEIAARDVSWLGPAVGLLQLLATWMDGSPEVSRAFLREGSHVHLLIELVGPNSIVEPLVQGMAAFLFLLLIKYSNSSKKQAFDREGLLAVVKSRIGLEVFFGRIYQSSRNLLSFYALENVDNKVARYFDFRFIEYFLEHYKELMGCLWPAKSNSRESTCHGVDCEAETGDWHQFETFDTVRPTQEAIQLQCRQLEEENQKLKQLTIMYQEQLEGEEREHEEMMSALAAQDSEIAQLREMLARWPTGDGRGSNGSGSGSGSSRDSDTRREVVHGGMPNGNNEETNISTSSLATSSELQASQIDLLVNHHHQNNQPQLDVIINGNDSSTIPLVITAETSGLPQGELYYSTSQRNIPLNNHRDAWSPKKRSTTHDV